MYQIYTKKPGVAGWPYHKILLIMRLTTVILITSLMQVSAASFGQRITLEQRNAPLSAVLKEIRKQSGFDFYYDFNKIPKDDRVSVSLRDAGIEDALKSVFSGMDIEYTIEGRIVTIRERKKPYLPENLATRLIEVRGRVTGENGEPLVGAVVRTKVSGKSTRTDDKGEFVLSGVEEKAVLVVSFVGYQDKEIAATAELGTIAMKMATAKLDEVSVVSTGYQTIPKERATGSFSQLDNELVNRRVSTNLLDRIGGVTSGVYFNGSQSATINTNGPRRNSGINVRGQSTIIAAPDPLIVLDNFPYQGEISNINPNDIESITVLKDAAAASIWGASAGNGVIVITTKKGRLNQQMKVEFNSSVTVGNRPDLYYDNNFLSSKDYIGAEKILFDNGFFNTDISNTTAYPAVSPVVAILAQLRSGTITQAVADAQLAALPDIDVRDDIEKYVYQKSVKQQYSLGIRGGSKDLTYFLSAGRDDNRDNLVRNGYDRTTLNSQNTYTPIKGLELTFGLNYSQNTTSLNNNLAYGSPDGYSLGNSKYLFVLPYASLVDGEGNPAILTRSYNSGYISSTASKGFFDWNYRPLDELALADNSTKINDLLVRAGLKYDIMPGLNVQLQYQNEHQAITTRTLQSRETYFARNLINQFSVYNASTQTFNYVFPVGGILTANNYDWQSDNLRAQLNFNRSFGKHEITALAGSEIRQLKIDGTSQKLLGYDAQFGTGVGSLNYNTSYPTNPSGNAFLPAPPGSISGSTYRYVSYFANAAYTYDHRYTLSLSGRKDGSNIFGVNANDRVTPLWSAGLGWNISSEEFYHVPWLPYLKARLTYGYNGNVYNGNAYLTGQFTTADNSGLRAITVNTAPNPELRWERIKNINLGIDFGSKDSRITGTFEVYRKEGVDLLEQAPLAPQTGFTTYTANAAATTANGIDLTLQSRNLTGKLKWSTTLLFSTYNNKVTKYDVAQTATSIQANGSLTAIVGKPLYSIFSYKWAGLDPANGDPQGMLNGKVSKDYSGIINNYNVDSLVYSGSARPTVFGSFRNDFSFKGISLSFNITYKLGYVFRRGSVSPNYASVLTTPNADYAQRWQKPGDEASTNVPSFVYPANSNRSTFYTYAQTLVQSGDHFRLQDIRLGYDIPTGGKSGKPVFSKFQVYAYANNLGIIWRKNKLGIDPDNFGWSGGHSLPEPTSISLGINANF